MESVIETNNLIKEFITKFGIIKRSTKITRALDSVNVEIRKNEILGLIGESGSGKSTLGLALLRLLDIDAGIIKFNGEDILKYDKENLRRFRSKTQMIFQDPYGSLNPVVSIFDSIAAPLRSFRKDLTKEQIIDKVIATLEMVGLKPIDQYINKFPNQLSGGQRQRVGIARAIINDPIFLVADEPVSMLDVSLRADILNILLDLKRKLNTSMLFISHDITVTQYVSDKILVMHLGQIVESADSNELIKNPLHPYTKQLIESIPVIDLSKRWSGNIEKETIMEYSNEGEDRCAYSDKCPFVMDICKRKRPEKIEVKKGHEVACYLYEK